jgi:hypothetical protein
MVQWLSLPNCYSDAGDTNSKKPPIPAIPIPTAIQIPITTGEADRVLAQPAADVSIIPAVEVVLKVSITIEGFLKLAVSITRSSRE